MLARLTERAHFTGADDLVFPDEVGEEISDDRVRDRFKTALRQAGLPDMRFHDLRHTFGTLAVRALPLELVQIYMGHKNLSTTKRYTHYVPQHGAARRLGEAMKANRPLLPRDVRLEDRAPSGE